MKLFRISLLLLFFYQIIAAQTTSSKMSFALVSDTHIGGSETAEADLERTVADLNELNELAFVIFSGDITEFGADEELKIAKRILNKLQKNWYIIPGNHDTKWSESGCNSFKQIFGYERFDFNAGGYKFVGCSSGPNMRMAPGLVPQEDLVWLDSIVTSIEKTRQPLIFVNHYPLDEGLANWYKVVDILKRANTQAILCGHGHRNKSYVFEGIPGTMGRSNLRARDTIGGYNIVTMDRDSLFFQERTPLVRTNKIWRAHPLQVIDFKQDTTHYARPSFDVNKQYKNVQVIWKVQDNSDIGAGIITNEKTCFYTNANDYLVALNKKNGKVRWKFKTQGKIFSTPALN